MFGLMFCEEILHHFEFVIPTSWFYGVGLERMICVIRRVFGPRNPHWACCIEGTESPSVLAEATDPLHT